MHQDNLCFHCLSPILANAVTHGTINGQAEQFCCHGCLGVAQWVNEAGLNQYYRVRTGAPKADNIYLEKFQPFDLPEIYQKYTVKTDNITQIDLTVEGIHCAACMWLIEKSVLQQSGVTLAEGNATTFTLHLEWDDNQSKLSALLKAIAKLGYQPLLGGDTGQQARYDQLRRTSLKRLALAGLGMMQVMMYSVGLYVGAWQGMSPEITVFLQWVSFFLATPIFFYAGFPFLQSAAQALKVKHLNMDVPVAIAITLAYSASVYHLLKGNREIFFDSVVMFIFFLSASRYLEMMGRYKALLRTAKNTAVLPEIVAIAESEQLFTQVSHNPIDSLKVGDLLLVRAGEIIAADGTVLQGNSLVNEALLTGESNPVTKSFNSKVLAGSINQEQALLIRADAIGQQTTLAETKRLLSIAQTQKPHIQKITDRLAAYIVGFILLSTSISYIVWQFIFHADNAFEIALSVLVATCPCALSLAVPTAYAAAANVLEQQRLFIKNSAVMDKIIGLNRVIFDKTGTLTTDNLKVIHTEILADLPESEVLSIAASLEQHIHHPIAKAFLSYKNNNHYLSEQQIISGKGVIGKINGVVYSLGSKKLMSGTYENTDNMGIYLCKENQLIAQFFLSDEINASAQSTVTYLKSKGLALSIASGDSNARVKTVAEKLGIDDYHAEQLPVDKLNWVSELQQQGQSVMMIGDGINDAPVLAVADISLAVGGASALSQSQADIILLNNDLRKIPQLINIAKRTRQVIRQNIVWAVIYNIAAVPLALLGYLPPWVAALSMSISSLVVLANALRIYWEKSPKLLSQYKQNINN
ncbi:MAG: heavy metal translocating P-type ATPase [Ostreibacterium sp.]